MTSIFHVAVVASQPKKVNNRKVPFPTENSEFIKNVLSRVDKGNYGSLSHGATDYGVDAIAESFAQFHGIKQRQFPAYWFDPTKEKNLNKAAGIASREAMIRNLSDLTYNKENTYGMLLVFHTQEDPRDDQGLKALLDFCAKYHPKIQVRTFQLPVVENPKVEDAPTLDLNPQPSSGIPDPFKVPN
jgi:hypothetical protein